MKPGTKLTDVIAREFGQEVLSKDQGIDRRSLGSIVFAEPERLKALERLVHPEVRTEIASRIDALIRAHESGIVVIEAVKLLESPLLDMIDVVWFVGCTVQNQRTRLESERGQSGAEAQNRMSSAPSFDFSRVTTVINNDGSRRDLAADVDREWDLLISR
jgi:dephospho-CoA kinase